MPPVHDFATDNNHLAGICTGMSVSWGKFCLRKACAPANAQEMGLGASIVAELGQKQYLETDPDTEVGFSALLQRKNMTELGRTTRTSGWFTRKKKRFKDAAYEVVTNPGVYLICTSDHTMGVAHFGRGPLVFLDPNDGQYTFAQPAEFPGFYWSLVRQCGYNLHDSILIRLGRV
jgi:hypothetical protein